ncbi:MAG: carboxypeptidase M32 [Desulfurococcales archaeon]|nr:carboxypeptidase M32 [Desulfurococcales archaeon]
MVSRKKIIREIIQKYRTIWSLGVSGSLMGWDQETYMPPKAVKERSIAGSNIAVLRHQLLLKTDFVELVEKAYRKRNLNDVERGIVRVLKRSIDQARKIPPEHVAEVSKTTTLALEFWKKAKAQDNYDIFKPYLGKIIELTRKTAEYLGYEKHPLDALLDLYEEGLTTRDVDNMFAKLEPGLKKVYEKIMAEHPIPDKHPLEEAHYKVESIKKLNRKALTILGYPWDRARLDVSAHPFTIGIGINDVRITTRYEGFDFKRSLLGTIHEFGHALYELGVDQRFMATPVAGGVSLGVHESQSRFWENQIGRSKEFVESFYPYMKRYLVFLRNYTPEDVYLYFNTVRPSLIRTEADEVTYNFHIMLRYKLEKMMIEGSLNVDELPHVWNEEMERLLGVAPKNYSEGVLQDIHWSMGSIGYFPTYSIGTLLSAQIMRKIREEIPDVDEDIRRLKFRRIRKWLRDKIHRHGSVYPPKELIRRALGMDLEPEIYVAYLERKYLSR